MRLPPLGLIQKAHISFPRGIYFILSDTGAQETNLRTTAAGAQQRPVSDAPKAPPLKQ